METVRHADAHGFAALARPLYAAAPLRHTVELTLLERLLDGAERVATGVTLHEARVVVGALVRTPGRPALVSGVPTRHAAGLAEALSDEELLGASGPVPEAEAFAAAHAARTGDAVHVALRMRLFALGTLTAPTGVSGRARRAGERDTALLAAWRQAFASELAHPTPGPYEAAAALRLGYGELVWEAGGVPVAQASAKRPVAGMSRIGPVYTPPEHRNHGYAAAVTAAAARWALDEGAEHVLLFTDLANAATNRLYPRIGFRPVHDAVELAFRR